jgi:hypothetical protein
MNESTFLIRKADNLYDACSSRGHKGIFLVVNQYDSPIVYWGGRSATSRNFVGSKVKEVLLQIKENAPASLIDKGISKDKLSLHEDIFGGLGEGERGLFTVYIDESPKGYGFFYKCEDPFSKQLLNDTLERFVKDVENQPFA